MKLTLDTFRRRWPAMGEQVCPELVDMILAVKPRRRWFWQANKSPNLYRLLVPFVVLGLLLAMLFGRYTGIGIGHFNLFLQVFVWGNILFGLRERREQRMSGPFCLTRFLSEGNAVLVPDLWLTGLSFPDIAATEAAVAYLRQPPLWKQALGLLPLALILVFLFWYFHISWTSRIVWLWAALGLAYFALTFSTAPLLQINLRLHNIYVACSVENTIIRPIFTGSVSARGRSRMRAKSMLLVLPMVPFAMVIGLVGGLLPRYVLPLAIGGALIVMELTCLVLMPDQIKSAFDDFSLDGQARFQQLVEKIAAGK